MGVLGDSKSTTAYSWGTSLIATMNTANNPSGVYFAEDAPRNWAVNGMTIPLAESSIASWLASHASYARNDFNIFLIDLGVNWSVAPTESEWKASYKNIIDAILAKYSGAKVYLTKPWKRGWTTWPNTLAGWIDDIVADYSGNVLVGDDERTWLEGGDDGATNTSDGIHYSTAGGIAKVAATRTALGY